MEKIKSRVTFAYRLIFSIVLLIGAIFIFRLINKLYVGYLEDWPNLCVLLALFTLILPGVNIVVGTIAAYKIMGWSPLWVAPVLIFPHIIGFFGYFGERAIDLVFKEATLAAQVFKKRKF